MQIKIRGATQRKVETHMGLHEGPLGAPVLFSAEALMGGRRLAPCPPYRTSRLGEKSDRARDTWVTYNADFFKKEDP